MKIIKHLIAKVLKAGTCALLVTLIALLPRPALAAPEAIPFKVPAKMPDQAEALSPASIKLEGFLGQRVANNAANRLAKVDLEPLLAGYRQKPGTHPWIGEHIGKWLHAATLAWAYTGDAALRTKLDYAAAELIKAQEPDGYLGTYVPEKRFGLYQGADWDVWSHKYCLIGLLTYYQYTGNAAALDASRKAADLLIATFPAKKSILAAGTHVGMAATSVLEPMVVLYRFTGEQKYLEFARYIVKSWDEPNGPKIIATLLKEKQVNKTANAKAYEMLSNLVGLCELARATGERALLEPVLNAWADIVRNRLYITGSASQAEHFKDDHVLPNDTASHICETCVTTTWIQLNWQLRRLTGETRFMDQLETTFYNHLSAAQRPDGAEWCYYTSLEGTKPYGPGINCCVSSGPRGMALVPPSGFLKTKDSSGKDVLLINLPESGRVTTELNGQMVTVIVNSEFPDGGTVKFKVEAKVTANFGIKFRVPTWARGRSFTYEGRDQKIGDQEWLEIPARKWNDGDTATLPLPLPPTVMVSGMHGNQGRACLKYGPFVLAFDAAKNPGFEPANALGLVDGHFAKKPGGLEFVTNVRSGRNPNPRPAVFVPFADGGASGGRFQVWMHAPGAELATSDSLFFGARESRSRAGNLAGSINDGDTGTVVVTFDGTLKQEDSYAVELDQLVTIQRIVFHHGKSFHDGGWFDASAGKPAVQINRFKGDPMHGFDTIWEPVGTLTNYPNTTATNNQGLKDGQAFTLQLATPMKVNAIRISGKPATGDNPKQAFSSCAELQAFEK